MVEIATRLAPLMDESSKDVLAALTASPQSSGRIMMRALSNTLSREELVIVVDQFEEVFTLCGDEVERESFITVLTAVAGAGGGRVRVVLGIRADFYADCGVHGSLVEAMRDAQFTVGPMTVEELRRTITHPARKAQCAVESGLLIHLVSHAHSQPGALPLLSHALRETWRRRKGNTLTLAGFHATGGIQGALSTTAEALYADLDDASKRLVRDLFTRLTAPGDRHQDTRRRLLVDELDFSPDLDVLLDRFARARLITLDHDTVEVSHEILINAWPRLRGWLDEDREALRLHRALTQAARQWVELDSDPGALYRGARLSSAQEWMASRKPMLTTTESAFLDASVAAEQHLVRASRRRTRRLRQFVALLASLLLLTGAALIYAVRAERTATEQRNVALVRKTLVDAAAIRDTNPALSLQLTLAAHRLAPMPETRNALFGAFTTPFAARLPSAGAVAATSSGNLIATVRPDPEEAVELWDISDAAQVTRLSILTKANYRDRQEFDGGPRTVEISPDGRALATIGAPGVVHLWDIADPGKPVYTTRMILDEYDDAGMLQTARTVAFDATSRIMAVGHEKFDNLRGAMSFWDVSRLDMPVFIGTVSSPGSDRGIRSLTGIVKFAMSADRKVAMVTNEGLELHLWDAADPRQPVALQTWRPENGAVTAVAFSPSGSTLAVATAAARTVELRDLGPNSQFRVRSTITGHTGAIETIAFAPDGHTLATAGADKTVRLVDLPDLDHPQHAYTLNGHVDTVTALAFARGGDTLLSASRDNTARLVDLTGMPTSGHRVQARSIALGLHGTTIRTVIQLVDGSVEVFEETPRRRMYRLAKLELEPVGASRVVTLSSDGRLLGVVTVEGIKSNAEIWDLVDPAHPKRVFSGSSPIVIFAPDNEHVVTHHEFDRYLEVRDRNNFKIVGRTAQTSLAYGVGPNYRVAIDSSWHHIAIADQYSIDVLSLEYSAANPKLVSMISFPPYERTGLSRPGRPDGIFDGQGNLIVVDGANPARIWPLGDGVEPPEPADSIRLGSLVATSVAVDEQTQRILLGGQDGTLQLWNTENIREPQEQAAFRAHDGAINDLALTPNRLGAVTVGNDYSIRFWDLDLEHIADRICQLAHPRLTTHDWETYFPGALFEPPCPTP
ncbi:hypothetical protein ADK67_40125 [Saccharothrix sp. NRRL B-16348]|nr:hypothetical protein ADK67_40125 [Saccharothrix sp. NRRL B-16348]